MCVCDPQRAFVCASEGLYMYGCLEALVGALRGVYECPCRAHECSIGVPLSVPLLFR